MHNLRTVEGIQLVRKEIVEPFDKIFSHPKWGLQKYFYYNIW